MHTIISLSSHQLTFLYPLFGEIPFRGLYLCIVIYLTRNDMVFLSFGSMLLSSSSNVLNLPDFLSSFSKVSLHITT